MTPNYWFANGLRTVEMIDTTAPRGVPAGAETMVDQREQREDIPLSHLLARMRTESRSVAGIARPGDGPRTEVPAQ
jgi:hypothetical protein